MSTKTKTKAVKKPSKSSKPKTHPFTVGAAYVFRTVTMYVTGRIEAVYEHEIALTEAAWIPDTGRFNEFLRNPLACRECEPFPNNATVGIGRGSIVDFCSIERLPTDVK